MNYKKMALLALLLPVASYGIGNEARIKELKEARFQKELELSKFGEMITKKDAILRSFESDTQDFLSEYKDTKSTEFEERNNGLQLSDEELTAHGQKLLESVNKYLSVVCETFNSKKSIKGLLVKGLSTQNIENIKEFNSLQFLIVKCAFERSLLVTLVEKYEACLQALIDLDLELAKLNK